jgi:hypothetical protein
MKRKNDMKMLRVLMILLLGIIAFIALVVVIAAGRLVITQRQIEQAWQAISYPMLDAGVTQ